MHTLLFNEAPGLHVRNQQDYMLLVEQDFVEFLGCEWPLPAMVLHSGATKNEGHIVVYIVFEDKWWLCDDAKVKG